MRLSRWLLFYHDLGQYGTKVAFGLAAQRVTHAIVVTLISELSPALRATA